MRALASVLAYVMMHSMKRTKLLNKLFSSSLMAYDDVVTLLKGLEFTFDEDRDGSRVHFRHPSGKGMRVTIHAPHGREKQLLPYQVLQVRKFLKAHGVKP